MLTALCGRPLTVAPRVLPPLGHLYRGKGVELRCCPESRAILEAAGVAGVKDATDADWTTEYLAPILSIAVVDDLDAAMDHIARYDKVWVARRVDIARHWAATHPAPV